MDFMTFTTTEYWMIASGISLIIISFGISCIFLQEEVIKYNKENKKLTKENKYLRKELTKYKKIDIVL